MNLRIYGELTWRKLQPITSFEEFVREGLSRWVTAHGESRDSTPIYYRISLHRYWDEEQKKKQVECRLSVIDPAGIWNARERSSKLKHAFSKCLLELHPANIVTQTAAVSPS